MKWPGALKDLPSDVRSGIVGVIIAVLAGVVSSVVLHDHVEVRAWIVVVVAVVVGFGVFLLYRRVAHLEGALQRAEANAAAATHEVEAASATPQLNKDAQDLLRQIEALRATITRRTEKLPEGTRAIKASGDEAQRFVFIRERVRDAVRPMRAELYNLLQNLIPQSQTPEVEQILSGLDQMETEVTNWGYRDPGLPQPGTRGGLVLKGN
jgi:hypothetical protein